MRHRQLALPVLLTLAGAAGAAAPLVSEALLSDKDHSKLGKTVAEYWEAQQEERGINEAYDEVRSAFDKLDKKVSKKLDGDSFLKSVEDWESVFYHANQYSDKGTKKGKVENRVYEDERFGEYRIAIHTPKKYSSKNGPFPLVVCIPPKGKKGSDHLMEDWVEAGPRDTHLMAACDMPTNMDQWNKIGTPDLHGGIDTVLLTLKSVKDSHAVDVDRIYLTGFGEGVATASEIASLYPHVFAGVIGRAGDLGDVSPANFRNLPTMFAGGGEKCSAFQAAAKEAGAENVMVEASATEADIWAWLGEVQRAANPAEITLTPRDLANRQAYWLNVEGFELENEPTIHARVDTESNTIHIESTGISTATIYFNDEILDLSRPVKVVCNGSENEDFIPRNLKAMLDIAFRSGDSGRVYVNTHTYDLPAVGDGEGE
ncbi:MAG: PHB depolymerase family esterase [Planctomycetota bacterium]